MRTDRSPVVALIVCLSVMLPLPALAVTAQQQKMLDQLEQLDQLDHLDFLDKDEKANACIQARDFDCAAKHMARAARLARNQQDKESLQMTQKNLAMEQELLASERRARREREEAEEEERVARERAIRAQEIAEEREAERQRIKYAAMSAGFILGGGGQLSAQRQAEVMSAIARDSQLQGSDTSNFNDAKRGISAQQNHLAQEQANIREQQRELQQRQARARAAATQEQSSRQLAAATPTTVAATPQRMPQVVQYVPQNVTIPAWSEACPPGSSPARNPNGTTVTAGSGAGYCLKDAQVSGQQTGQATGDQANAAGNGQAVGAGAEPSASDSRNNPDIAPSAGNKKAKWGSVQLEALAVCRQIPKSGKWKCNGALDNQVGGAEPTLEEALARQHCATGTVAVGGPMIKGEQWTVYQCGHSLGPGDYDVAKRYNLVTPRRSYMCKANFSQRCATPYSGQDKG